MRTVTTNISTGGLYFEVDLLDQVSRPEVHSVLNIELTVPPGNGYFPYEGRVTSAAEVLRRDSLPEPRTAKPDSPTRVGVAVRFRDPLKLVF